MNAEGGVVLLVLARKAQQEIMIGSDIIVSIIKVRGNKIKLGITAPADVAVSRPECQKKKDRTEKNPEEYANKL